MPPIIVWPQLQQCEYFLDNSVHVDRLTLWRRFLVERTYPIDDFSCTIPVFVDFARRGTGPIQVGRVMRKPFHAAIGAGDGGRDGLFDFVCQRSRHFPQCAHPIDVGQIGLELSQFFTLLFSTIAIFNIRCRTT